MNKTFENIQAVLLFVSGTLLVIVGTAIVVSPGAFFGSNNIELGQNISLLNELKAPAGLLFVAGVFIIIAVFRKDHHDVALKLSALIYLSYAASRIVSMVFDGVPHSGLIQATALEATIGLACFSLIRSGTAPVKKLA